MENHKGKASQCMIIQGNVTDKQDKDSRFKQPQSSASSIKSVVQYLT